MEQLQNWLAELDALYEEKSALLQVAKVHYCKPESAPSLPAEGPYHEVPSSLLYALGLLTVRRQSGRGARTLRAVLYAQDDNPKSPTYGNYRWYAEDPECFDPRAGFIITLGLLATYYFRGADLPPQLIEELRASLGRSLPLFTAHPAPLGETSACLGELTCALLVGQLLKQDRAVRSAQRRWRTFYEYTFRRGLPEGYSPSSTLLSLVALSLLEGFAREPQVQQQARELKKVLLTERAFFAGRKPVPSRRLVHLDGRAVSANPCDWLLGYIGTLPEADPWAFLVCELHNRVPLTPREINGFPRILWGRLFDDTLAVTYLTESYALGAILDYPYPAIVYEDGEQGAGWQDCPVAFSAGQGEDNYGFLRLRTVDADGVTRQHPSEVYDFASRTIVPRRSFSPVIRLLSHQHENLLLVLTDLSRLDAELRRLEYVLCFPRFTGRVYLDGELVLPTGQEEKYAPNWVAVECGEAFFGFKPLQRANWTTQEIEEGSFYLRVNEGQLEIRLPHLEGEKAQAMLAEGLGNGVVIVAGTRKEFPDVAAFTNYCRRITIIETWTRDEEIVRPHPFALLRRVRVSEGQRRLALAYDYQTKDLLERTLNGEPYPPQMEELYRVITPPSEEPEPTPPEEAKPSAVSPLRELLRWGRRERQ
ncbi:MAG TPA: hypothetical protein EYP85_09550 [Armatimonadetes bacterium]|nr:hypothetical protein [Armatimonadota bacterium]